MNVHFIDTSVFLELLNVPGKSENHERYMKELVELNQTRTEHCFFPLQRLLKPETILRKTETGISGVVVQSDFVIAS